MKIERMSKGFFKLRIDFYLGIVYNVVNISDALFCYSIKEGT